MVKKLLIIASFLHEKNKQGLMRMLHYINTEQIEYKVGTVNDIPNYDIIYSPSEPINTSLYPSKKFLFGPHFSTFPDHHQLQSIKNTIHHNSIYIQPSEWVVQLWKVLGAEQFLPIKSFPFPVDTDKFKPIINGNNKRATETEVVVYHKIRHPNELHILKSFLTLKNIKYTLFDYGKKYNENDYIYALQHAKYGIWLGRHESQGFALEEALSMNVPLLVWDAKFMSQEYGYNYNDIPCTAIPYWDHRCGESFYTKEELESTFQTFQNKLNANAYMPRQYILENLTTEKCAERFMDIIN